MPDRCAICGEEPIWAEKALPPGWEAILKREHGLEETEGYYMLPSCESCAEDVSLQRELDAAAEDPSLEPDDETRELLADIDLGALIIETDTDPFASES